MITLCVDETTVVAEVGETLFQVAAKGGSYIPALCAHPAIPPSKGSPAAMRVYRGTVCIEGASGGQFGGCGLCLVEVAGQGCVLACETIAQEGMVVSTKSTQLDQMRRDRLAVVLIDHPHACIYCPYGDGCDQIKCSLGIPVEKRCCAIFGSCELKRMAQYLGRIDDLGEYVPQGRPKVLSEPLIAFDYELCVGCARCVAACHTIGNGALGYTLVDSRPTVGTIEATLKASRCNSCGACIEVCPTAALTDKSPKARAIRAKKLALPARLMPERSPRLALSADTVGSVGHMEGVYQLLDERGEVLLIKGAEDLCAGLEEALANPGDAVSFTFVEDQQYTSRESQLLQEFLQQHGRLPRMSLNLDDLF